MLNKQLPVMAVVDCCSVSLSEKMLFTDGKQLPLLSKSYGIVSLLLEKRREQISRRVYIQAIYNIIINFEITL